MKGVNGGIQTKTCCSVYSKLFGGFFHVSLAF